MNNMKLLDKIHWKKCPESEYCKKVGCFWNTEDGIFKPYLEIASGIDILYIICHSFEKQIKTKITK